MSSATCVHAVRMLLGETESGVFCLNAKRLCSPCHLSGFGGGDQLVRMKRNDVLQARHDYATMGPVTRNRHSRKAARMPGISTMRPVMGACQMA